MPDRLSLVVGAASGLIGVFILARLDIPVIERGGLVAALAALELVTATLAVCGTLGLITRGWS